MIYQILLVDDEPIILAGIKYLIDWEKNNCHIVGTARNGQQALEAIEELKPHIVLCDINMPVFSGIEVIKATSAKNSLPVFIMLTNYDEFNLAIESMRYRAVDYLLKSHLDGETLEKSLQLAKDECDRRGGLNKVELANQYIQVNKAEIITQNLKKIYRSPHNIPQDSLAYLQEEGILQQYFFMHLFLDYSALPNVSTLSEDEISRLFNWQLEVIEKLAGNTFTNYTLFDLSGDRQSLVLFCWNIEDYSNNTIEQFYTKLGNASSNITQVRLSLTATELFADADVIVDAMNQFNRLNEYYYNFSCPYILYEQLPAFELLPLSFQDLTNKLIQSLRAKSIEACSTTLSKMLERVTNITHARQSALKECTSLYSTVASIIEPMMPEHQYNDYFSNNAATTQQISRLLTRNAVKAWLTEHSTHIQDQLEQLTASKSDLAEKAKNYVIENVDQRIFLQDVADYVNLSPNYLSSLFKKEYNCNFVDFINEMKMERACTLINEGKYKIYEISFMLGFDNAYYFTKVFKKQIGMTPTEYQRKPPS